MPFPREALERAALAGQLVEIAADVLDGRDAGAEQHLVRGVPLREILDRVAAGRLLVFRQQILDLRAVAVRPERGRERMIDAGGVDADQLDLLLHQPLGRLLAQARRVAEIFLAVGIAPVPAGVDQHDVAGADFGLGLLQVRRLDQLPFLLRDRHHHAGAEEALEREVADRLLARQQMDRRVHVRRGVEDGRDLVGHHAVLGVIGQALELDLLVAGEDRRIHAPRMAELVELKPAHRILRRRHTTPPTNATDVNLQ